MTQRGFGVAAFRDGAEWRMDPLPPSVLDDLSALVSALRAQPPEGGPFVVACVEDEFFVIARQDGRRISMLLSDLTAAVEFPLAEQAMTRLGEEPPADDELDEAWPVGDLDLFDDLELAEDEVEDLLEDPELLPEEMLETIMDRLDLGDLYGETLELAGVL